MVTECGRGKVAGRRSGAKRFTLGDYRLNHQKIPISYVLECEEEAVQKHKYIRNCTNPAISYVLDYANVAELLEKYIRNRILVTVLYVLECSKTFHAKLIIKVNTYETVNKAPHDFVSP